jgi:hypothetical protein
MPNDEPDASRDMLRLRRERQARVVTILVTYIARGQHKPQGRAGHGAQSARGGGGAGVPADKCWAGNSPSSLRPA